MQPKLKRDDLVYPELSFKIIGCAFNVQNELGEGQTEKIYQRALAKELQEQRIGFKEQVYYSVKFRGEIIGKNFIDFLIEDKVVVEIKKGDRFSKKNIDQVLRYLKATDLKLAILINFGRDGVVYKRIINF
jgi:GxxExxY protein